MIKKKIMKKFILFISLIFCSYVLYGQFVVDAEIRPRVEFNDGLKSLSTKDQSPALVTSQRTRLNLNYQDDRISTRFSIQDARIWGESVYKSDVSTMNVFEAWVGYKASENFSFKLGRQAIKYDDLRLIGPSNWGNVGASHDLALFQFKMNSNTIHLGMAYNNDKDKRFESNYPLDYYKYLTYLWYNKKWNSVLNTSVMNVFDGYQKEGSSTTLYKRGTSGLFLGFGSDSVASSLIASAYYQYGKSPAGESISAYFASISYGYSWNDDFKTSLGIDYFSGDDFTEVGDKNKSFNNLYGDGHGYYGYMDYFTNIENHTDGGGLVDLYLRMEYAFNGKLSGELTFHNFNLAQSLADTITLQGETIKSSKKLGSEIDFMIKWKIDKTFELRAGYSTMLADKTLEMLKGGDSEIYQQWGWIMLTFKPVFLNYKK